MGLIPNNTTMNKRIIALYSEIIGNCLWVPFIIKNSHTSKMNLSLDLFVSMYACMCTPALVYMWRSEYSLWELVLSCHLIGPILSGLSWCQVPLPAELPCQPEFAFGIQNLSTLNRPCFLLSLFHLSNLAPKMRTQSRFI